MTSPLPTRGRTISNARLALSKLSNTLLVIASVGAAALGLEAALYFVPLFQPHPSFVTGASSGPRGPSIFVADPAVGWVLRPGQHDGGAVTVTSQGYRGAREVAAGERPVVFLGDSFTYGSGVRDAETFPALIERAIDRPVANLGIPGFGLDQMWATLRGKALPLAPRALVIGFVDVDFERALSRYDPGKGFVRPWYQLVDGALVPRPHDDVPGVLTRLLDGHSRLWRVGELAVQGAARTRPVGQWWHLNAALLAEMRRDAAAAHVPTVFVRLPMAKPVAFPLLQAHMDRVGATYLDLHTGHQLDASHFLPDGHPSPLGHRVIAAAIAALLRAQPHTLD